MNTSMEPNKSLNNINKLTYVTKTFYTPKNFQQPIKSVSGYVPNTSVTPTNANTTSAIWNSSKALLNKDVKDKAYLFKSQKYIRDFKGNSTINPNNDSSVLIKK